LFCGGVIAGWPPHARLERPFLLNVGETVMYPQGVHAAAWMQALVGQNKRIATDYGNARTMLVYGNQFPLSGEARGVRTMLNARALSSGVMEILTSNQVEYVLIDRRLVRDDALIGRYFSVVDPSKTPEELYFESDVYDKFDSAPSVDRVFDSGDIYIFDVEALSGFKASQ
jgi:hypothetical protein